MQTYIQKENELAAQSNKSGAGYITMKVGGGEGAKAVRLPDSLADSSVNVEYFSAEANNKTLVAYSFKETE